MRTFFENELRDKLNGIGAGKLPPLVHDALVSDISTDMQAALTKSLNRRTKPIALARLVHACLTRQAEGLKGAESSFDQFRSASPARDEAGTIIGASAMGGENAL
jgi:hypothetical protein